MSATKEQVRQIIADNNLNSLADVYSLIKDSFKDILQDLMEAEMDDPSVTKRTRKEMSLYARGISTRDIHEQIQDLYGMELSAEIISRITDRILPEIKE